eukprot:1179465-Prorocentrum_minimum.AAC.16
MGKPTGKRVVGNSVGGKRNIVDGKGNIVDVKGKRVNGKGWLSTSSSMSRVPPLKPRQLATMKSGSDSP